MHTSLEISLFTYVIRFKWNNPLTTKHILQLSTQGHTLVDPPESKWNTNPCTFLTSRVYSTFMDKYLSHLLTSSIISTDVHVLRILSSTPPGLYYTTSSLLDCYTCGFPTCTPFNVQYWLPLGSLEIVYSLTQWAAAPDVKFSVVKVFLEEAKQHWLALIALFFSPSRNYWFPHPHYRTNYLQINGI